MVQDVVLVRPRLEAPHRGGLRSNLFLVSAPVRCSLHLFHGEVGKDQVREIGEEGESFGFIQREAEELFLTGKRLAELVHEILFGALDFGE